MPDLNPVNIFIAYAHADEAFLRPLRKHLAVLEDDGVSIWYDGEILPGDEWDASIKKRLKTADIIILLVSIDFLTSDYVKGTELPTALSRHAAGECAVVPVIVRNCLWQKKLGTLQALPKEAFPVENWSSRDTAYHNVAEGVEKIIESLKIQREKNRQIKENEIRRSQQELSERQQAKDEEKEKEDWKFRQEQLSGHLVQEEKIFFDPFADLMVFVKGGAFDMGSDKDDSEKPIHRVVVPDFYICKYPVTKEQWRQIMGVILAEFQRDLNRPVENVSWHNAQAFIKKLNELTGKRYRLPSEAEWEYAARGGSQSKGYEYSGGNNIDEVAWCGGNSGGTTHPVGQKKPNEIGLYDMSGNVWEWCEDVWHKNYKRAPEDGSVWWYSKSSKTYRIARGGSSHHNPEGCRAAKRHGVEVSAHTAINGFRLAHDYPM